MRFETYPRRAFRSHAARAFAPPIGDGSLLALIVAIRPFTAREKGAPSVRIMKGKTKRNQVCVLVVLMLNLLLRLLFLTDGHLLASLDVRCPRL